MESWDRLSAGWMASREEANEALSHIAEEVDRLRSGASIEPPDVEVARPLLHHRLTEALRTELTRRWEAPSEEDPGEASRVTLELLSALDEYRARIWGGWQDDLAKRLSEPDAFELVVELAHDLRSPLNSILFLSEVLRSGHSGPVSEHQRSQLGLIYSATLGIISVVNDVMDMASEGKDAESDEPVLFSIGKVFESVEEIVRPMAEEKGLVLEFRAPDRDRCAGFPKRLSRVLLNLTTNALKFTEEGSVTVAATRVGLNRIEFVVSDTGRGIPPEKLESLFHPFQKSAYRDGHFFSGSGLGGSPSHSDWSPEWVRRFRSTRVRPTELASFSSWICFPPRHRSGRRLTRGVTNLCTSFWAGVVTPPQTSLTRFNSPSNVTIPRRHNPL